MKNSNEIATAQPKVFLPNQKSTTMQTLKDSKDNMSTIATKAKSFLFKTSIPKKPLPRPSPVKKHVRSSSKPNIHVIR